MTNRSKKNINLIDLMITDILRFYIYNNNYKYYINIKHLRIVFNILLICRYFITSKNYRPVAFYRVINYFHTTNHNVIKYIILGFSNILTSIEISYESDIGEGLLIPHAQCIVVGTSQIGSNVTIQQGVTIGANFKNVDGRLYPTIGNNVFIGSGSKILGPINIGNNCMVGANAVVLKDFPDNCVIVGVPAKIVRQVESAVN